MLLPSSKNCQFRNNSSLNSVKIALYAIAVPVRNVNKSGVRTVLATGGHVTFLPYVASTSVCWANDGPISLVSWDDTYSTICFVLEELRWDGQLVWLNFSHDFLHEFLVVDAVRSCNVDLLVIDVLRVKYPSNMILLPFDLCNNGNNIKPVVFLQF